LLDNEHSERLGREPPPIPSFPVEQAAVVKKGKGPPKRSSVPVFIATIPPPLPNCDGPLSSPSMLVPADLEVLRLAMLKSKSMNSVDVALEQSSTSKGQNARKSSRRITAESTTTSLLQADTTSRSSIVASRGKRGKGGTAAAQRKPTRKTSNAIEPIPSPATTQLSSPLSDTITSDEFVPVSDRSQNRSLRRIVPSQPASTSVSSSSAGLTLRPRRQLGTEETKIERYEPKRRKITAAQRSSSELRDDSSINLVEPVSSP